MWWVDRSVDRSKKNAPTYLVRAWSTTIEKRRLLSHAKMQCIIISQAININKPNLWKVAWKLVHSSDFVCDCKTSGWKLHDISSPAVQTVFISIENKTVAWKTENIAFLLCGLKHASNDRSSRIERSWPRTNALFSDLCFPFPEFQVGSVTFNGTSYCTFIFNTVCSPKPCQQFFLKGRLVCILQPKPRNSTFVIKSSGVFSW